MNRTKYIFLISLLALFYSCAPKVGKKTTVKDISENLSQYRPTYSVDEKAMVKEDLAREQTYPEPVNDITTEINTFVRDMADYNREEPVVNGYTIVIPGRSRQDATDMRQRVYSLWPELKPELKYDHPNYKVKVGDFYSKSEAQRVFSKLKKEFDKALLVPERIKKPSY